ncbi:S-layer family protein [Mobilisporobacter senegalensis]|uniref:S-layer family protein n=1 Tax=Mobilisporobacter senegalensis TaxID=1329262 RepID=A0A3N1XXT9_9FIRM|nr:S-layer homology domain-containing protein [Mobilisporobacter senegalensis]ROR31410.1 S-layer family protein [Mobilisporobacter senegalensis]
MKKKILAFLLAIAMLSTFIPANTVVRAKTHDAAYANQVIDVLGIMNTEGQTNGSSQDPVTRAEFAQMLVNLSKYKDTVGATTSISLFKDVTSKFEGAGYIEFAITQGWMTGYIDGNFKPNKNITLQEAVNGIVAILGYTNEDFATNKNAGKMSLYTSKDLDENISKTKNESLNRADCANLFYNTLVSTMKDNTTVYATTLGYALDADGELDYLKLVNKEMDGPIIASISWSSTLPFTAVKYYRNDVISDKNSIEIHDVIYYSKNLKTVWAYSEKVTGILKEVSPSRLNPTEITIAGSTYTLGTKEMSYEFSTLGDVKIGDAITLLLGKDDTVVGVLSEGEYNAKIGGVVLETSEKLTDGINGSVYTSSFVTLVDSSGRKLEVEYQGDKDDYVPGEILFVSYSDGKASISKYDRYAGDISGDISSDGSVVGGRIIANDVRILDVKKQEYIKIPSSRLAGMHLYASNILYYSLNGNEEIQELILDDVTGDLSSYGILIDTTANINNLNQLTSSYQCMIDGVESTYTTNENIGGVNKGVCKFDFNGNTIESIKNLSNTFISSINGMKIKSYGQEYIMADEVDVYLLNSSKYYKTTLSKVSDLNKYNLYAYYDEATISGGRIRIIVAQRRQ